MWPFKNKREKRSSQDYNYLALPFIGSSYKNSQALQLSAVYACVRVISDAIASLTLEPFKIDDNGYKYKIPGQLSTLLGIQPNQFMGRFMFFKSLTCQLLLRGEAFVAITRSGATLTELNLLNSDFVTPLVIDGDIKYQYSITNKLYNKADIISVLLYSEDGINGISAIQHGVWTMELASNSNAFARGYFKNGASMGGYIKTPHAQLPDEVKNKWRQSFINLFNAETGSPNGIGFLDGNAEFIQVTVKASDAQLLESRKYDALEIARFFGVPPVKIFDQSSATFSNVENYNLSFLTDCIQPICERIENEFHRKLFLPSEQPYRELRFDTSNLLRVDSASQSEYYTKLFQLGVLNTNEIRQKLNLPPAEGGNQHFVQVNLMPLDKPIFNKQPIDNKLK